MSALRKDDIVAVVGAGAMGTGIAQLAAQAGHTVLLHDATEGAADAGRSRVAGALDRLVAKGRLDAVRRDTILGRIAPAPVLADLGQARLVIEAITEDLGAKRSLFAALEGVVAPDAVLATNTSSLSVTAIAAGLNHPERVAGLHFFNPAPVMKLVEVVAGLASAAAALTLLERTAQAWGKETVRARTTPGFIVNRVARPFYAEPMRLLEEGAADVATLDALLHEAGGFRMGPFALMDLIGHDVNLAVTQSVFEASFGDPRFRPSLVQQELVAAGWLGRKAGRGFYDYSSGAAHPAPARVENGPRPQRAVIEGDLGPAEPLVSALSAAGVAITRREGRGLVLLDGAVMALTDGRSATARVAAGEPSELVLFDLCGDFAALSRVAITSADQAPAAAVRVAAGLFQALGAQVSIIDDTPGLVLFRTVAMLVNEAAEAVLQHVATAEDIDRAMTLGVAYPSGPLTWADRIGPDRVLALLEALQAAYGDDRYRPSLQLRRCVAAGRPLSAPSVSRV